MIVLYAYLRPVFLSQKTTSASPKILPSKKTTSPVYCPTLKQKERVLLMRKLEMSAGSGTFPKGERNPRISSLATGP